MVGLYKLLYFKMQMIASTNIDSSKLPDVIAVYIWCHHGCNYRRIHLLIKARVKGFHY